MSMHSITTKTNGKTLFVSTASQRSFDGKYLVEYTEDKSEAHRFTKEEANQVIPKIHNPFNRSFAVGTVSRKTSKVVKSTGDFV